MHVATLVLFHNGLGDYVMALPALRALCAVAPRPLAMVFGSGAHQFLVEELCPDWCYFAPFQHAWPLKDFDAQPVLEEIAGCDTFVSLCPYESSGQSRLLSGLNPGRSIGFTAEFSTRLAYHTDQHEIDTLFQAACAIAPGMSPDAHSAPVRYSAATLASVARMREALGDGTVVVAVHARTLPNKMLDIARFDRLLDTWLKLPGTAGLVLDETASAWPLTAGAGRAGFLAGAGLERSMAVAAHSDVFVGIDSCMLHVADLARRPALALFGPTRPQRYGLRFSPQADVRELSAPTLGDLADEAILSAGFELLARAANMRHAT